MVFRNSFVQICCPVNGPSFLPSAETKYLAPAVVIWFPQRARRSVTAAEGEQILALKGAGRAAHVGASITHLTSTGRDRNHLLGILVTNVNLGRMIRSTPRLS